jgi:C4-dicarboxylate-binding protein DctP
LALSCAGAATVAAVAGVGLSSRAGDISETMTIKFSHVVARDTPKGKAAEYFKRLVESQSGGRITVAVYPNSELYRDKEELEALQLGSVQMVAPSLAKLGPLGIKEFELFDLPFLFGGYGDLRKVTAGPVGRRLLNKLGDVGLLGLTFWDNGFKQMSANRPLLLPRDFLGLRMRIQSSEVLDAQMRALGAIPDAMALGDVYAALASGVVDGTENPASNFYTQHMDRVQRYLTLSSHGYLGYVVIVNTAFWSGLPGDTRALLESCLQEATRYANEIAKSENDVSLERVRAAGLTRIFELDDSQRAYWRIAMQDVQTGFAKRLNSTLLRDVHRALALPGESPVAS